MKKEDLIAMGLSDEQAEKVVTLHKSELDGNYIPKKRFDEVNETKKTLEETVKERDKQLDKLKKDNGDNEKLQSDIKELQKANADQQKAYEAKIAQIQLDNAVNNALSGAGAKNTVAVRAMIATAADVSKFKLLENGTVEGLSDAIEAVRKSDPYMFREQENKFSGFQPGNSDNVKPNAAVDMSKMTFDELTAFMEANPNVK